MSLSLFLLLLTPHNIISINLVFDSSFSRLVEANKDGKDGKDGEDGEDENDTFDYQRRSGKDQQRSR